MKTKLLRGFLAGIFAILFVCVGYVVKEVQYQKSEQNRLGACIDFSMYR